MAAKAVTAAITAENNYTTWINPKLAFTKEFNSTHFLNISISGTWAGTVTLQRRFGSSDDARDVTDGSWIVNIEKSLYDHEEGVEYRIGIKTGDYTSGTANVRLGA